MTLDAHRVARRLAAGAALFPLVDAAQARAAMEGRLESDDTLAGRYAWFDEAVAGRLEVLRALNRRRDAFRERQRPQPA